MSRDFSSYLFVMIVLVVIVGALLAAGLVHLVRRYHPCADKMRATDDVEGIYVTVLATLYAIFIAFMIFVVWQRYYDATQAADQEATVLTNVYRIAGELPEPMGARIRSECMEYARTMIEDEWPAMREGVPSLRGWSLVNRLWRDVSSAVGDPGANEVIRDHLMDQFVTLTALRRQRLLHADIGLPDSLDAVLILGAILVIGFAAVFSTEHALPHMLKTVSITVIIALMLFTVWELDTPFSGSLRVTPDAFREVLDILHEAR